MGGMPQGLHGVAGAARWIAAAGLVAACVSGCGGSSKPTTTTTAAVVRTTSSVSTTTNYTYDAPAPTFGLLLGAPVTPATAGQVKGAFADLYRNHPDIASFTEALVVLPPRTRDAEFGTCVHGGGEHTVAAIESVRLLGCASLIFLFYSYAQRRSSKEGLQVARQVYGYAVTHVKGPDNPRTVLGNLLRSWGVE